MPKPIERLRIYKNKRRLEKEELAQYDEQGNIISVTNNYKKPNIEDDLLLRLWIASIISH